MSNEQSITRRQFVGRTAVGLVGALAAPTVAAADLRVPLSATDAVALGRNGVRVSRLGFGTGSDGGSVQRRMGQQGFTRLVRYALDRGVTLFDTADN
jgi:1-deoxyxylulose-5-phosphate synthase